MKKALPFVLAIAMALSGSLAANAQVVVKVKPVRPKVKVVKPAAPGPNDVWVTGGWTYNKRLNKYVWHDGRWARSKRGQRWVAGHWVKGRGGHRWVAGHWVRT